MSDRLEPMASVLDALDQVRRDERLLRDEDIDRRLLDNERLAELIAAGRPDERSSPAALRTYPRHAK